MKLFEYIRDTNAEMKHVSWPSRGQIIAYTLLVIVISLAFSAYLGVFDSLFAKLIGFIIQ